MVWNISVQSFTVGKAQAINGFKQATCAGPQDEHAQPLHYIAVPPPTMRYIPTNSSEFENALSRFNLRIITS